MRPGEVQSDTQAFRQVLGRLESEVGSILKLIPEGKKIGMFPNTAPVWALLRMMFPIAEAVGDLLYPKKATSQHLPSVLENEFEAVRAGYKDRANILTQLFRHSLAHTDELRRLVTGGREVRWALCLSGEANHLQVDNTTPGVYRICFVIEAFYDDLVAVCHNAIGTPWGSQVMNRYNGWLTYNFDEIKKKRKLSTTEKAAIREMNNL
jgi:hypothetical protein